jgi:formamidopyrimidine-DNA glycosylase
MPELPEIYRLARQMDEHLRGKVISALDILQPKCLNVAPEYFRAALTGAEFGHSRCRGKWVLSETSAGTLALSLGMGGEVWLVQPDVLPEKRRLVFNFSDGSCLSINFWWFGYAHYIPPGGEESHAMTSRLGPNALDVSAEQLKLLFKVQRGALKIWLLDQSKIAGIGNAYIHDILFFARLHPLRRIESLKDAEIDALADGIRRGLLPNLEKGGAFYETDLFGQKGGFQVEDIVIGYREGTPCPVCAAPIEKIKTGGTSSFICPNCQPL